ncbi:DUF397 domain-containing protein [Streptomyces sp. NPDC016845]|uniref:DUF397 domain-containing protein n=1 Tax=Streptomyces sp. NPDC016845 TaxID=3364972 RepID=UPI00379D4059
MTRSYTWRKSSYSGAGEGNNCVEVAALPTHVGIRDSKTPGRAALAVPHGAFGAFVEGLKARAFPSA